MTSTAFVRVFGRVGVVCVALVVVSLVGVQYAQVIARNVALARDLHAVESDLVSLKAKHRQQERELKRLSDPHGAVPEIHDRLHLLGEKEAIIYLKRHGSPANDL